MTSSRTFERWTMIAALFVLIGQILLPSAPARAAVAADALLQPTPLVLKDGRIANVSIHVLPFDTGNGELAGPASARLAELIATVATDCFLTAQVIGHVSSREVADNETLAAHRLARARADAVQASLIGGGLPAKSIASVWDWQFLVREPRATLVGVPSGAGRGLRRAAAGRQRVGPGRGQRCGADRAPAGDGRKDPAGSRGGPRRPQPSGRSAALRRRPCLRQGRRSRPRWIRRLPGRTWPG